MSNKDKLVDVVTKNISSILIEAPSISTAFNVFKSKFDLGGGAFEDFNDMDRGFDKCKKACIIGTFEKHAKFTNTPLIWGGLILKEKKNTLVKKLILTNHPVPGTKKWKTTHVVVGVSGRRYLEGIENKSVAISKASELIDESVITESVDICIEKTLVSHTKAVATLNYIKDDSEHLNVYLFMANSVSYEEMPSYEAYERNVSFDEEAGTWSIISETIFEYEERLNDL